MSWDILQCQKINKCSKINGDMLKKYRTQLEKLLMAKSRTTWTWSLIMLASHRISWWLFLSRISTTLCRKNVRNKKKSPFCKHQSNRCWRQKSSLEAEISESVMKNNNYKFCKVLKIYLCTRYLLITKGKILIVQQRNQITSSPSNDQS